jgi:hypothetical protein
MPSGKPAGSGRQQCRDGDVATRRKLDRYRGEAGQERIGVTV